MKWKTLSHYNQKALEYAEDKGIPCYSVDGNVMTWVENYPYDSSRHELNLDTMKEKTQVIYQL